MFSTLTADCRIKIFVLLFYAGLPLATAFLWFDLKPLFAVLSDGFGVFGVGDFALDTVVERAAVGIMGVPDNGDKAVILLGEPYKLAHAVLRAAVFGVAYHSAGIAARAFADENGYSLGGKAVFEELALRDGVVVPVFAAYLVGPVHIVVNVMDRDHKLVLGGIGRHFEAVARCSVDIGVEARGDEYALGVVAARRTDGIDEYLVHLVAVIELLGIGGVGPHFYASEIFVVALKDKMVAVILEVLRDLGPDLSRRSDCVFAVEEHYQPLVVVVHIYHDVKTVFKRPLHDLFDAVYDLAADLEIGAVRHSVAPENWHSQGFEAGIPYAVNYLAGGLNGAPAAFIVGGLAVADDLGEAAHIGVVVIISLEGVAEVEPQAHIFDDICRF